MLAIELDDYSHHQAEVKKRDIFVNAVFAQVGIPLIRIHVNEMEKLEQIVEKLSLAWITRWHRLESAKSAVELS